MTNHEELLARLDAWLGTGDSDTADFLHDMRDAATAIRGLTAELAAVEAETIDNAVVVCALIASTGGSAMHCVEAIRALANRTAAAQDGRTVELSGRATTSQEPRPDTDPAPAAVTHCARCGASNAEEGDNLHFCCTISSWRFDGRQDEATIGTTINGEFTGAVIGALAATQPQYLARRGLQPDGTYPQSDDDEPAAAQVGGTDSLVHSANGPAPAAVIDKS